MTVRRSPSYLTGAGRQLKFAGAAFSVPRQPPMIDVGGGLPVSRASALCLKVALNLGKVALEPDDGQARSLDEGAVALVPDDATAAGHDSAGAVGCQEVGENFGFQLAEGRPALLNSRCVRDML